VNEGEAHCHEPQLTTRGQIETSVLVIRRRVLVAVVALAFAGGCRLQPQGSPKTVAERAPAFALPDHNGNQVELANLRERGPVVIVFYRGHW
jgi:cytochrome oxidase Cu insertion factor (SCO1/SenC/PrrC family)